MNVIGMARSVFDVEIEALREIRHRIDSEFERAIEMILAARGRVVVVGMGKSGIVGRKIAATLASTGTHSFFVHPGEAFHGDLGMIREIDVVLMISNSGETEELVRLLPFMEHQRNVVIAMTGKRDSTLALHADCVLDISVPREACNNNLAPTSSTTATLVMGDALAVTLSSLRGFQPEDFARFHPGGSLGRKLLTRVSDVMHRGSLPFCGPGSSFREVIHAITRGRVGLVMVMEAGRLVGLITDGDVRRALERSEDPLVLSAAQMMTSTPLTIKADERFAVGEERMREAKVNSLIVTDENGGVVGVLQIYDMSGDSVQA